MENQPSFFGDRSLRRLLLWILGAVLVGAIVYLVWRGILLSGDRPNHLVVYAYSTQEEAMTEGIFPAFEQAWRAETGEEITIEGVFGPSGTLSQQIVDGAPADIAVLSNQRHIDWLIFNQRVNRNTQAVLIASTPMVIVTRPENPGRIMDFADLGQPGILLLHADPGSSGAGEWSLLAEYGSAYLATGERSSAEAQLKNIWQNVHLAGSSARVDMTLFELGACDALVTYEQDAYLARQRGVSLEIISPPRTILTEHYAVIVDDNVTARERQAVEGLMQFMGSDQGQQILSHYYFRTAGNASRDLPALIDPFTVEDLGGWTEAYNTLIVDLWMTDIKPLLSLENASVLLETAGER